MQQAITVAHDNLTKHHWFYPLSFQRVQALLTLFSKSFSSFPHGTCLLSVSNLYLALDEIYHLWRSKPEERDSLKAHRTRRTASDERDSHPRWCAFPSGLHLRLHWLHISKLQFKAGGPNFNAELIPVHSPLLRESCLVSYPPLTYMLKFSGFADLTSCQGSGRGVEPRRGLTCRGRATVTGGEGRVLLVVHRRRANTLHASRARSTLVHRRGLPTR